MCISNAVLIGMCYLFSIGLANLYVFLRVEEARRCLDRGTILRIVVATLVFAIPTAGTIKLENDWLFTQPPHHCMGRVGFMALSWIVAAPTVVVSMAISRVVKAGGPDILASRRWQVAWRGMALGFPLSLVVLFGGHLWWREVA